MCFYENGETYGLSTQLLFEKKKKLAFSFPFQTRATDDYTELRYEVQCAQNRQLQNFYRVL